jgi:hypothetical protein
MIVKQDHCRGANGHRLPEDIARVGGAGVQRAHRYDACRQPLVAGVEQDDTKLLDGVRSVFRHEPHGKLPWRPKLQPLDRAGTQGAAPQLNGRENLSGARRADTRHLTQFGLGQSDEPAGGPGAVQHRVGKCKRIARRAAVAQDDGKQLVVAEPGGAETVQLFARPVRARHALHRRHLILSAVSHTSEPGAVSTSHCVYSCAMLRLRASLSFGLVALVLTSACGAPPEKEMHQAQGAIDAARAAGAEDYATDEFTAAVDALKKSEDAVAQRDFRLALNHALDSLERAQNAAKQAANQKAAVRSAAEHLLAEVTSATATASDHLAAARGARAPKPELDALQAAITAARTALDQAGKALASTDYLDARRQLAGVTERLHAALHAVVATPPARPTKPARRRR